MPNVPRSIFIKVPDPPCKNCADREVGCHAKCTRYSEWKTVSGDMKYNNYIANAKERMVEDYEIIEKQKNIKRRKSGGKCK